jgi:uridylate kinase
MATQPLYKRILYKVSGEALMGDQGFGIDPKTLSRVASDIVEARALGVEIGVVVGGGNIFRGISLAAKGADRVTGDHMGMLATVMNALSLRMELEAQGVEAVVLSGLDIPAVCEPFSQRALIHHRDQGRVIIFSAGTGSPYFTTDTGAALRAAEFGAEALFKGTQVDGVYSADPKKDKNATRYDNLTHSKLLEKGLEVMDAAAVSLARDNNIPVVVFSIREKGGLARVLKGEGMATTVSG